MTTKKKQPNGITAGMITVIVISMSIVGILAYVKIYLSNHIYYESKHLNKKYREIEALKAENEILKRKVEALRFRNQVTDTIFELDEAAP